MLSYAVTHDLWALRLQSYGDGGQLLSVLQKLGGNPTWSSYQPVNLNPATPFVVKDPIKVSGVVSRIPLMVKQNSALPWTNRSCPTVNISKVIVGHQSYPRCIRYQTCKRLRLL